MGRILPWKSILSMLALLAVVGAAQLSRLERALPGTRAEAAAAVLVPLAACGAWMSLVMTGVTNFRVRMLLRALRQISAGNFAARFPEPREPVLRAVSDAFAATSEALQRLTGKLAHADAERRRLFADLAHELATPSAAILGLADTLATPSLVPTEEARAALLATLEQEALRLARLVGDLRELATVEDPDISFSMEPVDAGRLVADAVERFRVVCPEGAPIVLRAEAAWARADPARLEQALVNLLRNAKRHAPGAGSIDVEVRPAGAFVDLVVEDGGPPLGEGILEHLGERLFRGDPSRSAETGGAGLGLAIVRSIVHRHGGKLEFARGAQGGLRVTLRVPARDGNGGACTPPPPRPAHPL